MHWPGSKVVRDAAAEVENAVAELFQELAHAAFEDPLDATEVQVRFELSGEPFRFSRTGVGHASEIGIDLLQTTRQRSRHVRTQNQQLCNPERRDLIAEDLAIGPRKRKPSAATRSIGSNPRSGRQPRRRAAN